jgi:hypothetical protein
MIIKEELEKSQCGPYPEGRREPWKDFHGIVIMCTLQNPLSNWL